MFLEIFGYHCHGRNNNKNNKTINYFIYTHQLLNCSDNVSLERVKQGAVGVPPPSLVD